LIPLLPDRKVAAQNEVRIAHRNLDAALEMLPPAHRYTFVASRELAEVIDRVKAARRHLHSLEAVAEPALVT
jgi:hypothetical protein